MNARQWNAKQILSTPAFAASARRIQKMLNGFDYCLIGGLAVGHYANPVVTIDVDVLVRATKKELEDIAMDSNQRYTRLEFPSSLQGLPKIGISISNKDGTIDLISSSGDWFLEQVVDNSKKADVAKGVRLPLITLEDLVIMKTLVGRDKDMDDVGLLMMKKVDQEYIDSHLERLQ